MLISILLPQKKGFYVDVGANLPATDSVTKFFYDRGWRGINIEPIPHLYEKLVAARPKDINLNIGIAKTKGVLKLREYQNGYHGWSTFSRSIKNLESRRKQPYKDITVDVEPLEHVFRKHGVKHIDFLKIDVEGMESEVLQSNNWSKWRPEIVVIENTPGKWMDTMKKQGYTVAFFDGLNYYFALSPVNSDVILKDFSKIYTDYAQKELNNAISLSDQILESPENYISNKKIVRTLLAQLKRRIRR